MSNTTVVFDPNLYVNGGSIAWGSNTTLTVSSIAARDFTNSIDLVTTESITINAAINGVNGLDVGSLAASLVYYVFLIGDLQGFNPPGFLLSLSPTAPAMPLGYGALRYLGRALTDGSSHFLLFYSSGKSDKRYIQLDAPLSILSNGSSTSFAALDCLIGIGNGVVPVYLNAAYTPNVAASIASIRPTGSSASDGACPINLKGSTNAVAFEPPPIKILPQISSGHPSIDYIVDASDALSLSVVAFEESL